jgi:5'-nucleotidase
MKLQNLMLTVSSLVLSAGAAMADYSLTILHTNDFHARFEPISKYDGTCGAEDNEAGKCFGGSARLVTAIADARARSNNSILVDGGDQFQGTLFYNYYKGKAAAEMMNKLAYDGMTVGNHEFDDGPEVLRGFMDAVQFPVLMSNVDVSSEPALAGVLKKSTVIDRGGEKLGLIGLTTEDVDEISSPGPNVIPQDSVSSVQAEVDTGVDVIVGGHTNTYLSNTSDRAQGPYPTMVGDTAIVQAYAYGKFLGELNVTFDDAGKLVSASGEPLIIDAAVAEDAATKDRIAELAAPLNEIRNKVVAQAGESIDGERSNCRTKECAMGNLVADAMLERVKGQGIQIAIQNGGGLRSSINAGDVTLGEVFTVLPFQNTLATFQIKGAAIKDALENAVAQYDDPDKDGRFAQVAGMTFVINKDNASGQRITDIMVSESGSFVPLDADKTYGVVTNNFVRNGGDGYAMFKDGMNAYDYGPDLADVVVDYMVSQGSYAPYTDGRIVIR